MNSFLVRKPRAGGNGKCGPGAGKVCVRLPGKPMNSFLVRKPRARKIGKGGPADVRVCVRLPGKPMNSVSVRKPRAGEKRKMRPGGRPGLRTTPRKANEFGFGTQTTGRKNREMRPGRSNFLLLFSIGKSAGNKIQSHLYAVHAQHANMLHMHGAPIGCASTVRKHNVHSAPTRRANTKEGKRKQCEK